MLQCQKMSGQQIVVQGSYILRLHITRDFGTIVIGTREEVQSFPSKSGLLRHVNASELTTLPLLACIIGDIQDLPQHDRLPFHRQTLFITMQHYIFLVVLNFVHFLFFLCFNLLLGNPGILRMATYSPLFLVITSAPGDWKLRCRP